VEGAAQHEHAKSRAGCVRLPWPGCGLCAFFQPYSTAVGSWTRPDRSFQTSQRRRKDADRPGGWRPGARRPDAA
jgi:hypothetical protein